MRYETFEENKYYYISNSGFKQEKIFIDDLDKVRFILLATHFQSPIKIYNLNWMSEAFISKGSLRTRPERIEMMLNERYMELLAFSLTDSKFGLLVKNLSEMIVSVYMHRILTAYSKYFNMKYKKEGHVFDGPFKTTPVNPKEDLLDLSAYLHKGMPEEDKIDYRDYGWSSFQDYISKNRWGELLSTHHLLHQYKTPELYKKFVNISEAKKPQF